MNLSSQTLAVSIDRPFAVVAAYLAKPPNFPDWASGLASGLKAEGDTWIGEAPQGRIVIRFSPPNDFGVADHWVTLPDGQEVYVPLRVLAHGQGCEVILTLFRLPAMSDADFARDAAWVAKDLARLKAVLEG